MNTIVRQIVKQAEALSPQEMLELIMALLQRTHDRVNVQSLSHKWRHIRGKYPPPMNAEDAQVVISNMREEWKEREQV